MQLQILDPGLARVYGLPVQDTTTAEIEAEYRARGWTEAQVRQHLACAIAAGAVRVAEDEVAAVERVVHLVDERPRRKGG